MQQHNQGSTYTGAGPGQYDFRAAAANATAPKPQTATPNPQQTPAAQTGQAPYGYPNYQQQQYPNYPKPQGAGYGYYPQGQQQYGYPSQYGNVPPGQSYIQFTPQYGYGSNMYNQPRPNQQGGYNAPVQGRPQQPTVSKPQPTVPGQKTKPVAAKPGEPQKTAEKKPVDSEKKPTTLPANGEVVEEIITEDGKKKKIVKRVVKKTPSGRDEKPKADGTPRFVQEQVKEIKERTGEEPIVVVKSKQAKKKPSKEGVYEPSLKDMIFGPPKKDDSDKEADFFEWKCPECGTVNADYVSTCKCGCTQRRAQNIAKGRIPHPSTQKAGDTQDKKDDQPAIIKNEPQTAPKVSEDQLITPDDMFSFGDIMEHYDNPATQAEYIYSLLKSEVS